MHFLIVYFLLFGYINNYQFENDFINQETSEGKKKKSLIFSMKTPINKEVLE